MSIKKARAKEYQLLVARNFLRNISLDGTYEDTGLRIFNRPGLDVKFPNQQHHQSCIYDDESALNHQKKSEESDALGFFENNALKLREISPRGGEGQKQQLDLDLNFRSDLQQPPEIQVESPRSPDLFVETDDTFGHGSIGTAEKNHDPRGCCSSADEKESVGRKGTISPPVVARRRKQSWRERLQQKSLKENAGKKSTESFRSPKKEQKKRSSRRRKISAKSFDRGSMEGLNLFKKITGFLAPPESNLASKNSSSNVSATSLDSNRSEDESLSGVSNASQTSKGELRFLTSLKSSFSLKSDRICLLSSSNIPLVVYSILPYQRSQQQQTKRGELAEQKKLQRKALGSDTEELRPFELSEDQEISYSALLVPYGTWSRPGLISKKQYHPEEMENKIRQKTPAQISISVHAGTRFDSRSSSCEASSSQDSPKLKLGELRLQSVDFDDKDDQLAQTYHFGDRSRMSGIYDPNLLDNPEFGPGQHKTTLSFPGYITSIFDYVDAHEVKKEGNEKFRHKFAHIDLTYSKFKSIKREMRRIVLDIGFDLLTLAQSYVYFEKIVIKGLISKSNRKLIAAVCLIVAAKLNDSRGEDLENIFSKIESTFRISRKEFVPFELPVVVALDFSLHLPDWEIYPHYQKLVWAG